MFQVAQLSLQAPADLQKSCNYRQPVEKQGLKETNLNNFVTLCNIQTDYTFTDCNKTIGITPVYWQKKPCKD